MTEDKKQRILGVYVAGVILEFMFFLITVLQHSMKI